jgi:hypothetical protein
MNFWVPQTGKMGDGWIYTYAANKIRGFKQTHQPSPWMNDYGQFLIMPLTKHVNVNEDARASWFLTQSRNSKAILLQRFIWLIMILPPRSLRLNVLHSFVLLFLELTAPFILIDALDKGSYVKIIPKEKKIIGYSTKYARGPPKKF